eukprot:TRINITY_DN4875_c0_g1_i1.p1 TRINITY_DN4875_c0_g1~~TRINITY_DN4875_c0_g1_i1.p1  ORF type:complete len:310 (+),score=69.26 TRINITY_DN4875_c0_g1_i1:108-1037(+)
MDFDSERRALLLNDPTFLRRVRLYGRMADALGETRALIDRERPQIANDVLALQQIRRISRPKAKSVGNSPKSLRGEDLRLETLALRRRMDALQAAVYAPTEPTLQLTERLNARIAEVSERHSRAEREGDVLRRQMGGVLQVFDQIGIMREALRKYNESLTQIQLAKPPIPPPAPAKRAVKVEATVQTDPLPEKPRETKPFDRTPEVSSTALQEAQEEARLLRLENLRLRQENKDLNDRLDLLFRSPYYGAQGTTDSYYPPDSWKQEKEELRNEVEKYRQKYDTERQWSRYLAEENDRLKARLTGSPDYY